MEAVKRTTHFSAGKCLKMWNLSSDKNIRKRVRAKSNVHKASPSIADWRYTGMLNSVNLKKKKKLGLFCCVCTSCNKFESAPMTALQSSSVVLIRWLQSFGSQQHNAAEQASTAHSQKRWCLCSRTGRPLSLSCPEKMRCWCWRRHYGKLLFQSVKDQLGNFFFSF